MTEPSSLPPLSTPNPPETPTPTGVATEGTSTSTGPSRWGRVRTTLSWAIATLLLFGLFFAPDHPYWMPIYCQCLALAILALGVDVLWGYTGQMSLGQGLFFSLGGYAMGYCLTLKRAAELAYTPDELVPPSFMSYTALAPTDPDYVVPPALAYIAPLRNVYLALAVAILLPVLFAAVFGYVVFRLRIKGVYFALITQALVLAFYILVLNQQSLTGGVVGIPEIAKLPPLFGFHVFDRAHPTTYYRNLYYLIASVLVVCFVLCALLVHSKVGKILTAIRDNENRVLALGYNTALYKVFAFVLAAGLAGLAGALFVPSLGRMGPTFLGVAFSIEIVVYVAVGGRGTLIGAVLGAILIRLCQSHVENSFKQYWEIVLGAIFVGVVLLMPRGLLGVLYSAVGWGRRLVRSRSRAA